MESLPRHGPRLLVVVGWALLYAGAAATRTFRAGNPNLVERLWEQGLGRPVPLVTLIPFVLAAVWLWRRAPAEPRPPAPAGAGYAFARGVVLGALLCAALGAYLLAGGEDIFWYYRGAPVGTAALLAPLIGLILLLEHPAGRAPSPLRRAGWALLAFALSFVALVLAWAQREYVNMLFLRGYEQALSHAVQQFPWFIEDPSWTLGHFAWVGIPVAASLWVRSDPLGERTWRALALCGVGTALWLAIPVPAGDSVIAVTSALLCVLIPLAARGGDRAGAWLVERMGLVR